jgi:hypothetical protein
MESVIVKPHFIEEDVYTPSYPVSIDSFKDIDDMLVMGQDGKTESKNFYEINLFNPCKKSEYTVGQAHLPSEYPPPYNIPVFSKFNKTGYDGLRIEHVYIKPLAGPVPDYICLRRYSHNKWKSVDSIGMVCQKKIDNSAYLQYGYMSDDSLKNDYWQIYYHPNESGICVLFAENKPCEFELIIAFSERPNKERPQYVDQNK